MARVTAEPGPRDDVASVVEPDRPGEPLSVRLGADQDEEGAGRASFARPAGEVFDLDPLQLLRAVQTAYDILVADLDVVPAEDAVDEIARHAVGEVGAADDDGDVMPVPGEPDRRLAGRVASADDDRRTAGAKLILGTQRRVEHAEASEAVQPGGVDPPVADPVGNDHRMGREL